jgi:PTS system fructose-specific IIA component
MDITKILNTNRVILDMKATNKTEAIEELTDILQKMGQLAVGKRLFRMSGSVNQKARPAENHIAIPHGKSSAVVNTTGNWAYPPGYSRKPWMAATCAASFCLPRRIKILPCIFALSGCPTLADDDIIEQLLVESSPQKIIELFSQYAESNVC